MDNQPATTPPEQPDTAHEPQRFRPNLAWVIPAVTLAVMVVFGSGWLAGSAYTDDHQSSAPPAVAAENVADPIAAAEDAEPTSPATTEPTPTSGPTPAAADIRLTVKVTDKQCFGSAGCTVEVKLEMGYRGPTLSADDTFAVTYELTGDEDGPIIGTFEVTGDQYEVPQKSLSTKSSKTKIAAKVTGVEKVGI